MTEAEVATAISTNTYHRFHYRKMVMVPNVSWGMGFRYEIDLLALSKTGVVHEIEIKTSRSDLVRDAKKRHYHDSDRVNYLWFAGPDEMVRHFYEFAPERAGIIAIFPNAKYVKDGLCFYRRAKRNASARPFTEHEKFQLARLGTMRYWSRKA